MFSKILFAVAFLFVACAESHAGILRDHLMTASAEPYIFRNNHLEGDQGQGRNRRTLTGFLGDGNQLSSYGGYYSEGSFAQGQGQPGFVNTTFRLSFWSDEARAIEDPRLLNPGPTERSALFNTPSNPGWEVPALLIGNVQVYYFEFDLTALAINTVAGQRHYISVSGEGEILPIRWATSQLTNQEGADAIGAEPALLLDVGGLVGPLGSYSPVDRVLSVPAPTAVASLGLGVLLLQGRRRR